MNSALAASGRRMEDALTYVPSLQRRLRVPKLDVVGGAPSSFPAMPKAWRNTFVFSMEVTRDRMTDQMPLTNRLPAVQGVGWSSWFVFLCFPWLILSHVT